MNRILNNIFSAITALAFVLAMSGQVLANHGEPHGGGDKTTLGSLDCATEGSIAKFISGDWVCTDDQHVDTKAIGILIDSALIINPYGDITCLDSATATIVSDGKNCDDGDIFTEHDECTNGQCIGTAIPVVCDCGSMVDHAETIIERIQSDPTGSEWDISCDGNFQLNYTAFNDGEAIFLQTLNVTTEPRCITSFIEFSGGGDVLADEPTGTRSQCIELLQNICTIAGGG